MANEQNASPRIVAALSVALLTGVAPAALASDDALAETPLPAVREIPDLRFPSWIELGGYFGTNGTSRGELTLWTPLTQGPDDLTFFELRTKAFEGSALEGNFALGYRRQMPSGFNLGAWGGLDVRDTRQDNTFWQLSGGLEALSERIDARVNAYWPLTGPQAGDGSTAQVQVQGNNILMTGGAEVALRGVDAEIGRRTGFGPATLATYFGGYYFDHPDAFEDIAGGKARAELFFDDFMTSGGRLSFDYEFSYDDVREARHEVGLRLRLPIGGDDRADLASLSPQQLRMMDGLERDTDIVIGRSESERVEDALTGTDFDRVAFVEDGDTVTDVSAQAGGNSLLIQNAALTGAQTLDGDQTLQGGGSTIAVRGLRFGGLGAFTAPGVPASITNTGNSAVLTIDGTNTHVAGLTITGDGNQGLPNDNDGIHVYQPSFSGAFTQLVISNAGGDGIHIGGGTTEAASGNVTVTRSGLFEDVEIDNVGGNGVHIGGDEAIVTGDGNATTNRKGTFNNVTIRETGGRGVAFTGEGSRVEGNGTATTDRVGTFTDVDIIGTGDVGVAFTGGGSIVEGDDGTATTDRVGTFTNVTINGTDEHGASVTKDGVSFTGGASFVFGDGTATTDRVGTFTDVDIIGTVNSGVRSGGSGSTVFGDGTATTNRVNRFTDVTISGTGDGGVRSAGTGSTVFGDGTATTNRVNRFTDVTISGTGDHGVVITGSGSRVVGKGTATTDHEGTFTNVTIKDIATSGVDGFGILFAGDGDVTADFTNVIFLGDIGSGVGKALLGADGVTVTASGAISNQTDNNSAVCEVSNGGEFVGTATVDGTPLLTVNCP